MTDDHSATTTAPSAPGETIRALRKRLGLTLGEVSVRTGLGVSTLSKLEKGHASLSFEKLHLISRGLGVDMAQVLEPSAALGAPAPQGGAARRVVQRRGEGLFVDTHSYGQRYLATELLSKRLTPMVTEIRARTLDEFLAEFGGFIHHPGEEFSYVLEGEIEFHSEVYAPARLGPGDSVYFDSSMGHAYLAVGDAPCRLLTVCECVGEGRRLIDTFVEASTARVPAPEPAPAAAASKAAAKPKRVRR